jgi:hypothetical protein
MKASFLFPQNTIVFPEHSYTLIGTNKNGNLFKGKKGFLFFSFVYLTSTKIEQINSDFY